MTEQVYDASHPHSAEWPEGIAAYSAAVSTLGLMLPGDPSVLVPRQTVIEAGLGADRVIVLSDRSQFGPGFITGLGSRIGPILFVNELHLHGPTSSDKAYNDMADHYMHNNFDAKYASGVRVTTMAMYESCIPAPDRPEQPEDEATSIGRVVINAYQPDPTSLAAWSKEPESYREATAIMQAAQEAVTVDDDMGATHVDTSERVRLSRMLQGLYREVRLLMDEAGQEAQYGLRASQQQLRVLWNLATKAMLLRPDGGTYVPEGLIPHPGGAVATLDWRGEARPCALWSIPRSRIISNPVGKEGWKDMFAAGKEVTAVGMTPILNVDSDHHHRRRTNAIAFDTQTPNGGHAGNLLVLDQAAHSQLMHGYRITAPGMLFNGLRGEAKYNRVEHMLANAGVNGSGITRRYITEAEAANAADMMMPAAK